MNRITRSVLAFIFAGTFATFSVLPAVGASAQEIPRVTVSTKWAAHIQNIGWQSASQSTDLVSGSNVMGFTLGTVGQSLRLESLNSYPIRIESDISKVIKSATCSVTLQGHVQNVGWQQSGSSAGTTGLGLRLEAIRMWSSCSNVKLRYSVHVQGVGWMATKAPGQTAGTVGQGLRIEAVRVSLEFPDLRYVREAIEDGDCKLAGLC